MEKDYLDIAYTKRVERSQLLVDNLIKVYPEYFKKRQSEEKIVGIPGKISIFVKFIYKSV